MEEVKKLLVPAVSTRRGNRPNPNAAPVAPQLAVTPPGFLFTSTRTVQANRLPGARCDTGRKNKQAPPCECHISSPPTLGPWRPPALSLRSCPLVFSWRRRLFSPAGRERPGGPDRRRPIRWRSLLVRGSGVGQPMTRPVGYGRNICWLFFFFFPPVPFLQRSSIQLFSPPRQNDVFRIAFCTGKRLCCPALITKLAKRSERQTSSQGELEE